MFPLDAQQSGIGRERSDYVLHHYTEVLTPDAFSPVPLQLLQTSRHVRSNACHVHIVTCITQVKACYVKLRDSPWL